MIYTRKMLWISVIDNSLEEKFFNPMQYFVNSVEFKV